MTDPNPAQVERARIVALAVERCARIVRELGTSMSPGATAAALERNTQVIADAIERSDHTNKDNGDGS